MKTLMTLIELAALLGSVVLIAYGAWLIFPPAGFITLGVLALAALILHSRGSRSA